MLRVLFQKKSFFKFTSFTDTSDNFSIKKYLLYKLHAVISKLFAYFLFFSLSKNL